MTIHGEEEMENDTLSILDVENAILTGEITESSETTTPANRNIFSSAKH